MADPTPPRPTLQNPVSGTTIPTHPSDLQLAHSDDERPHPKSLVKRGLDKLSRSVSGADSERRHRPSSSLSRREKHVVIRAKEDGDDAGTSSGQAETPGGRSPPAIKSPPPVATTVDLRDDGATSALKTSFLGHSEHQSPETIRPVRPSIAAFRGDGSLRAGTQTLIQALQAIPWADEDGAEDAFPGGDTSEQEDTDPGFAMTSSIHTIHRPVARLRRLQASYPSTPIDAPLEQVDSEDEEEELPEDVDEVDDFEVAAASVSQRAEMPLRPPTIRTSSLATVKLQRRGKLAEKLREVFGLDDIEEVLAEMPCWLLRSILLQGYMYLTNAHLCFFAHLPSNEDQILKSGTLSKRGSRTKRWNKYWFILKNDVLSWYQSSSDPYFPHGNLDLRYAISCEPIGERGLRIRTNQRNVNLMADSVPSRDEWVKAVRKVMFKAQNMGESVKIAIPFSLIVDVDRNSSMDFTETIEVKVFDKDGKEESYSIDSYFFAYFHDLDNALEQIQHVLHQHRQRRPSSSTPNVNIVKDTTSSGVISSIGASDRAQSLPPSDSKPSTFRLSSLLRPFSTSGAARSGSSPEPSFDRDDFADLGPELTASPLQDDSRTLRPNAFRPTSSGSSPAASSSMSEGMATIRRTASPEGGAPHIYPPSWPTSPGQHQMQQQDTQGRGWSVPQWLKGSSRLLSLPRAASDPNGTGHQVFLSDHASDDEDERENNNMGFSLLDGSDIPHVLDMSIAEKFHSTFALDEKETLIGYLPGSLYRVLPIFGRIYISTSYFCFRSTQPLTKTRMIIPIRDVISVETQRAFRFGYHGLVVVIKGHEELFFEFGAVDKRIACVKLLEAQMDIVRQRELTAPTAQSKGQQDAMILEELEPTTPALEPEPFPVVETTADSLPAVMFTSTSSTFLTFKPQESLRFTFLTIGTRGDVQPYIALGKGLVADGHRVKIATHEEYKAWIEGHGLEHVQVGGDPAELMRICVENGVFTISFMKEGLQKFRGWLDDLLKSSWEACQDTDVLMESPSAMAGIHVAEALRIPYFRAFTMPWTRTRAYPHAFAVPDRKMGGSYNYMTYVMFDQVFWRATAGQINRWRRNVLGLPPTNLDKLEQHKVPFLYNFSPTVVPPPLDWYEWIRVTGYWFLDDPETSLAKRWTPPEDLVQFIDAAHRANQKVVYIGFGSIVVSDPDAMTQCVVQAVQLSGVRAILSKGWSDRLSAKKDQGAEEKEKYPPSIYPVSSIPHDWLFPRIDAACHHGGAGTTGASLRAGIPTIIKPFFGDQFFWSDRVEALGVGSGVRKLTVENLTEALRTATNDERQINRARIVGQKIREENGVENAIEAIYRDLDYARSLVKHPVMDADDLVHMTSSVADGMMASELRDSSVDSSNGSGRGTSEDWEAVSYTSG